jgi:NAD(P)-dependent dehydrogenase (short-subunit alcohol dehydrogenase family)
MSGAVVIIGGTSGLGREIATHYARQGEEVVISGRDLAGCQAVAQEIGGNVAAIAVDLTKPHDIAGAVADIGPVRSLVLAAIYRDQNTVKDYNIDGAIDLVMMKLVGYTEVIHALSGRLTPDAAIVLFGGLAKERPYPGSTTVTTINGGINNLVHTLALELAPIRVNGIHPGIVGDSPYWKDKNLDAVKARTPGGELVTMADIVGAVHFLLENRGVNGVNLYVDRGWLLT